MKKSNMKKSNMGMNILLFFVLVGSCLGVAAFVMSLTKKSGEGYSNLTHNNTDGDVGKNSVVGDQCSKDNPCGQDDLECKDNKCCYKSGTSFVLDGSKCCSGLIINPLIYPECA